MAVKILHVVIVLSRLESAVGRLVCVAKALYKIAAFLSERLGRILERCFCNPGGLRNQEWNRGEACQDSHETREPHPRLQRLPFPPRPPPSPRRRLPPPPPPPPPAPPPPPRP